MPSGQLRHVSKQISLNTVLVPVASGYLYFLLQAFTILDAFPNFVVNSAQLVTDTPPSS